MPKKEKKNLRVFIRFLHKSKILKGFVKLLLLSKKVKDIFQVDRLKIHTIGQTHLDTCWLWTWDVTKRKIIDTFKNNLENLKRYGKYKFTAPAPAHYEHIEKNYPHIFEEIKKFVQDGRWEPVGGMWVESDLIAPCGESLVRQRLFGQRYFLKKFGAMPRIAWTPDVFGFPWSMPQIYKKSGADFFFTTKLTWNVKNEFPFPVFWWQGPDGSKILAMNWFYGINKAAMIKKFSEKARLLEKDLPENLKTFSYNNLNWKDPVKESGYFSKEIIKDYMFCYGQGDGGNGPYELEIILVENIIGSIKDACHATPKEYFNRLEGYKDRIPIWNDECYLERHQGCPTTNNDVKHFNRICEEKLLTAEKICTMAWMSGHYYPLAGFKSAWKDLLFNQFHDILPGSSLPQVYFGPASKFAMQDYKKVLLFANQEINNALEFVGSNIIIQNNANIVGFHPCQWDIPTRIRIQETDAIKEQDAGYVQINYEGNPVVFEIQRLQDPETQNSAIEFIALKPKGLMAFSIKLFKEKPEHGNLFQSSHALRENNDHFYYSNKFFHTTFKKTTGEIISLQLVDDDFNFAAEKLNILKTFDETEHDNDAWDINEKYRENPVQIFKYHSPGTSLDGPIFSKLTFKAKSENSTLELSYLLYHELPYITCELDLDWHEKHIFFRVEFETRLMADHLTVEIPYAVIERPTLPKNDRQKAMFEFHGQKWVSLSDGKRGLTVFNKNRYGYSVDRNNFGLSLLRSPKYPTTGERFPEMTYPEKMSEFTDQGKNFITWCILPHSGSWKDTRVWKYAYNFNFQTITHVVNSRFNNSNRDEQPGKAIKLIIIEPDNVRLSVIKLPHADDPSNQEKITNRQVGVMILRIVESAGQESSYTILIPAIKLIKNAWETDLLELEKGNALPFDQNTIGPATINPFEIKTIKIEFEYSTPEE
ncbi:MAG: alpha-mannosidase [Promethearchaeota archaeon]